MAISKADYGFDAPVVFRRFLFGGAICAVAGTLLTGVQSGGYQAFFGPAGFGLIAVGGFMLACAGILLWGTKVGKFMLRDQLLDTIEWRGDEKVLDVGCGHGLLMIGAAKRLNTGQVTGIDIWSDFDQADNSAAAAMENVKVEGVADRVVIRNSDARNLPFEENSFDVVVSSLAIHNIPTREERDQALSEIIRVLKPGGKLAIVDIWKSDEYKDYFCEMGLEQVKRTRPSFHFVVPSALVTAARPA